MGSITRVIADHAIGSIDAARVLTRPAANEQLLGRARTLYAARRRRGDVLGTAVATMFYDPAWDLLLDLYIQGEEDRAVSVTSACNAANAPHSTAQRFLRALEMAGAVDFRDDPFDKRRRFVKLTADMHARMMVWLAEV